MVVNHTETDDVVRQIVSYGKYEPVVRVFRILVSSCTTRTQNLVIALANSEAGGCKHSKTFSALPTSTETFFFLSALLVIANHWKPSEINEIYRHLLLYICNILSRNIGKVIIIPDAVYKFVLPQMALP